MSAKELSGCLLHHKDPHHHQGTVTSLVGESCYQTHSLLEVGKSREPSLVKLEYQSLRLRTQKPGLLESVWASLSTAIPPPANGMSHLEEWGYPDHHDLHPGNFISSHVPIKTKGPKETSTICLPRDTLFWSSSTLTFQIRLLRRNGGLRGGYFLHV